VVDGSTTPVTISIAAGTYADVGSLVTAIQTAVDQTSLKDRVKVASDSTGVINFSSMRVGVCLTSPSPAPLRPP
jgi:hypothetical protein